MKEVYFDFGPSMQVIEMLPECLEHHPFLELKDRVPYSGKFRRLKSLVLIDNRFDFFHFKFDFDQLFGKSVSNTNFLLYKSDFPVRKICVKYPFFLLNITICCKFKG